MRLFFILLYGNLIVLFAFIGISESLSVCARRHHSMAGAFFQRIDLPSAIACIERCIEYMDICHSALFIRYEEKMNGVCQLHPINSEDTQEAVQLEDDESIEMTVYELLEKCPPLTRSDMMNDLSEESLNRLAEPKKTARALSSAFDDEIIQREEIFPKKDSFTSRELAIYKRSRSDKGYATMHSVEETGIHHPNPLQNPFESSYESKERPSYLTGFSNDKDLPSYGPSPSLSGLTPIQPIQILHRGQPMMPYQDRPPIPPPLSNLFTQPAYLKGSSCPSGSPCVPTLHQLDKSPCPARQGDPCAPKPPCAPNRGNDRYPEVSCQIDPPAEWAEWTSCSVTCGMGQRMRTCTGGHNCPGISVAPCFMPICQVWGGWGQWTGCSASCGPSAQRSRRRQCIGGNDCVGGNLENQDCDLSPCPEWSQWGPWEGCTQSCGRGIEKRYRRCEGGLNCPGMPVEEKTCDRGPCPYWESWGQWSHCSATCGGGVSVRTRDCINGPGCSGEAESKQHCNQDPCPIWSEWTDWSLCPKRCGEEAARIRNRACYYKGTLFSGCEGAAQDQSPCPVTQCPKWREWGDWGECSQSCGQGTQIRTRSCDGNGCEGPSKEMRFCQISVCPYWGEWAQWGGCSVTCGQGVCERKRKCIVDDLVNLPSLDELEAAAAAESAEESDDIIGRIYRNTTPSPRGYLSSGRSGRTSDDIFGSWSRKKREFSRENGEPIGCEGIDVERKTCDAGPCCYWDEWTDWSPCIGCGPTAISRRSRACNGGSMAKPPLFFQEDSIPQLSQPPKSNYALASNSPYKSQFAGLQPIVPVNYRGKRALISQYLQGSDCECEGSAVDTKTCPSPPPCESVAEFSHDVYPTLHQPDPPSHQPICEWTEWGKWCGCENCRAGRENRRRFCDLPSRTPGGPTRPDPNCHCPGLDIEERTCILNENCLNGIPSGSSRERPVRPSFPRNEETTSSVEFNQDQRRPDGRLGLAGGGFNEEKPVDYAGPIFSNVEISSIQKGPWSGKEAANNSAVLGRAILVQDFKKDALFSQEDVSGNLIGDLCRWSKWSGWSPCETSRLKQRNRFCIGANGEAINCQCMGLSMEETSCIPEETVATSVEFIALANKRTTQGILSARDEEENGNEENRMVIGKKCEWTRWSQWSPCTATCGTAERLRRRRCSCENESTCGSGITTEAEACDLSSCETNPSRPFPKFSIFS